VTEAEWLSLTDPRQMAAGLKGIVSDRKLRLFGVACCRRVLHLVLPESLRSGVELAERYVDGLAQHDDLDSFCAAHRPDYNVSKASQEANSAVVQVCHVATSFDGSYAAYFSANHSSIAAAHHLNSLKEQPDEFIGPELGELEQVEQMRLARDIFGNPFRPAAVEAGWRTEAVVGLALGMYDSRDFSPMPVQADALEDAGCANADILAHCRGDGPHVRGCWVVDAVLGKT
jgi:hypothetical protein